MIKPIYIVLIIIAIIAAILLIFKWNDWFGSDDQDQDQIDFDKCLAENKKKGDGATCTNCYDSSSEKYFKGIIKNGVCVAQKQEVSKYIIGNKNGAVVYTLIDKKFTAPANPQLIPINTEINILGISPDKKYANTSYGWISIEDISEI